MNFNDLEEAKRIINQYCLDEFEEDADFSDLSYVGLGFTTLGADDIYEGIDENAEIQVYADLTNCRICYELDGELVAYEQYYDLDDMCDAGLSGLRFDEAISPIYHLDSVSFYPNLTITPRGKEIGRTAI